MSVRMRTPVCSGIRYTAREHAQQCQSPPCAHIQTHRAECLEPLRLTREQRVTAALSLSSLCACASCSGAEPCLSCTPGAFEHELRGGLSGRRRRGVRGVVARLLGSLWAWDLLEDLRMYHVYSCMCVCVCVCVCVYLCARVESRRWNEQSHACVGEVSPV